MPKPHVSSPTTQISCSNMLYSFERTSLLKNAGANSFAQGFKLKKLKISSGNGEEGTPVPIPNTEVKLFSADGTWGVGPRESKSPPD